MKNILEYNGYRSKIELDADDGIFVGSVIGVKDSLNFHATNYEDLYKNFVTCIDDYLEMCKQFGKTPEKEYKGSFNVRITPELHKEIDTLAEAEGVSINQYIIKALQEFVNKTNV